MQREEQEEGRNPALSRLLFKEYEPIPVYPEVFRVLSLLYDQYCTMRILSVKPDEGPELLKKLMKQETSKQGLPGTLVAFEGWSEKLITKIKKPNPEKKRIGLLNPRTQKQVSKSSPTIQQKQQVIIIEEYRVCLKYPRFEEFTCSLEYQSYDAVALLKKCLILVLDLKQKVGFCPDCSKDTLFLDTYSTPVFLHLKESNEQRSLLFLIATCLGLFGQSQTQILSELLSKKGEAYHTAITSILQAPSKASVQALDVFLVRCYEARVWWDGDYEGEDLTIAWWGDRLEVWREGLVITRFEKGWRKIEKGLEVRDGMRVGLMARLKDESQEFSF